MEIDDFCGTTFNDGKLTVVGIAGKDKWNAKIYACKCSVCSLDEELFGDAVFNSAKGNLVNGSLPCGCSPRTNWSADQYRVLLARKAGGKYSVIVPDGIKSSEKVQCTCNAEGCGHGWTARIHNLLNIGTGCKSCNNNLPLTESEALERVQDICSEKGWTFNGFKDGWIGANETKLNIKCHCGCEWTPLYYSTVNIKHGCPSCANTGYSPDKAGTFYTHLWTNPNGHQFLKFGITNKPKQRIKQQQSKTKYIPKQLVSILFEDGQIAADLERQIDQYKTANSIPDQVSRNDFPDGFTETLPTEEWSFISNLIQERSMMRLSPITLP